MTTNHLEQVHAHLERILNVYCAIKGDHAPKSKRNMHRYFVLDEANHQACLEEAYTMAVNSNPIESSLNRLFGRYVLLHVRDCLIEAGTEIRVHNIKVHQTRVFDSMKLISQIHTNSRFKDVCKDQVGLLQIIGAELEAFGMVIHQQRTAPNPIQLIDENGNDIHGLFKFSLKVENMINDVRVMFNS